MKQRNNEAMKHFLILLIVASAITSNAQPLPRIMVSSNKRFFQTSDGKPFFWLGDTGWLLATKCNREDVHSYFGVRHLLHFNVVQMMLLHSLDVKNFYGAFALNNNDISSPKTT